MKINYPQIIVELKEQIKQLEKQIDYSIKEILKREEKIKDMQISYQNDIYAMRKRIEELESKLSRQHNGRPRASKVPDNEIIELRQQGKTVKEINQVTGISTATINRILKKDYLSKYIDTNK